MHALSGKKILVFTESYGDINGVALTTRKIIDYLRSHGANIVIVAPVSPVCPDSTSDQIRVLWLPAADEPRAGAGVPSAIRQDRVEGCEQMAGG